MEILTDVPIGIDGEIRHADIEVRGSVSERALQILEGFKKLPLELQEKMLLKLEVLRKKNADTANIDNLPK